MAAAAGARAERLQRPADPPRHRAARGPGESLHALAARLRADPRVRVRGGRAPRGAALPAQRPGARRRPRPRATRRPARRSSGGRRAAASPPAWDISQGDGRDRRRHRHRAPRRRTRSSPGASRASRPSTPRARPRASTRSATARTSPRSRARPGNNGVGLAGAGLGCRLLSIKSDFSDSSVARLDRVGGRPRGRRDQHELRHGPGRDAVAAASVNAIDYAVRARRRARRGRRRRRRSRTRATPRASLQPTGTGPDLNAGLAACRSRPPTSLDRRAPFAGPRHADLARRLRHLRRQRQRRAAGDLRRVHLRAERARHRRARPDPRPCRLPHDVQRPTPATPTCRARRWRRRWSPPPRRSSATSTRTCRAAEIVRLLKQTARRPAGTGWTPDLGWGILDAGAALALARDDRPPAADLEDPPHGAAHAPHAADAALARRRPAARRACSSPGVAASSCGARSTGASRASSLSTRKRAITRQRPARPPLPLLHDRGRQGGQPRARRRGRRRALQRARGR